MKDLVNRRPQWHEAKRLFVFDGSLRDIYVLNTSVEDWSRLLQALPHWRFKLHYSVAGSEHSLPESFDTAHRARSGADVCLQILAGDIDIRCHFFSPEEIEFDFDPRSVRGQGELDSLCDFLVRVANSVNREIRMTPENAPETALISYSPASEVWVFGRGIASG